MRSGRGGEEWKGGVRFGGGVTVSSSPPPRLQEAAAQRRRGGGEPQLRGAPTQEAEQGPPPLP